MLDKLIINGGRTLTGEVFISGAKNAALAIIPAALIIEGTCRIENLPDIDDVRVYIEILRGLGASVTYIDKNTVEIDCSYLNCSHVPYNNTVKKLRASYYLLGALANRFNVIEVPLPGGDDFGTRPIDQHIKGFETLGAEVAIEHGIIRLNADRLKGASVYMDVVSVGATINIMLSAVKAEGITVIENAAREPHIVDVANFLNAAGADIKGAGTDVIKIKGVNSLNKNVVHNIIPDQIEAGTYLIMGAATGGSVTVRNVIPTHLESLTAKLTEMNLEIEEGDDWVRVHNTGNLCKANIKTLPYPGFPTDLQPMVTVLLSQAEGTSFVTEGVWDSRFQYIDELKRMGANIKVEGRIAVIEGKTVLSGAPVKSRDLRGCAALITAGLVATGQTEVQELYYMDRGYEDFASKLKSLGADIKRVTEQPAVYF